MGKDLVLILVLNEKKHSILENDERMKIMEEIDKWRRESWQ